MEKFAAIDASLQLEVISSQIDTQMTSSSVLHNGNRIQASNPLKTAMRETTKRQPRPANDHMLTVYIRQQH